MISRIAAIAVLLLAAQAACKGDEKSASPPVAAPAEAAASATAANRTATSPAPAAGPAITEARARALLDGWLAAQNSGDFAAYEKLYAAKFQGVKRAGDRVRRFARAGWIADRKRMFGKPMTVEARESEFAVTASSAEVRFVQRWQSGAFEDLGPKRLFLVLEDNALVIAREEMLRSEVVSATGSEAAPAPNGFGFLLELEQRTLLVLDRAPVPGRHGTPRREVSDGDFYAASATVADADLAPELARWRGAAVKSDEGCSTTITGFRVVALEVPHFGTVQLWNGTDLGEGGSGADSEPAEKASDDEIAAHLFTSGRQALAAELAGPCAGVYGEIAGHPPAVTGDEVTDAALEGRAQAQFIKLPDVAQLQKEHRAEGRAGHWWDDNVAVQVFKHPGSGQVIVSVKADNGGTCGEFSASAWALYEVKGGALVALATGTPPGEIRDAIDVHGDGRLELITGDNMGTKAALLRGDGTELAALRYAYNDCPC